MKQNDRKSLNANTNILEKLCQMHKLSAVLIEGLKYVEFSVFSFRVLSFLVLSFLC